MSRGRRAVLLAGLALLLGALAASNVSGREAALQARVGRPVSVVVARADIAKGARVVPAALAIRNVPARYASSLSLGSATEVEGRRAAVAIPRGTTLQEALLADESVPTGPQLRPGERIADLVARGDPRLVLAGGRVDVLVTREHGDGGETTLALEDAEVLTSSPASGGDRASSDDDDGGPHVRVGLRVTVRQAVALAAAQDFAKAIRVLPRAASDRDRGLEGALRAG